MSKIVRLGRGHEMKEIPQHLWEGHLSAAPEHFKQRLSFMSPDHHRVRYFVVGEIARRCEALPPERIAQALNLSIDQIQSILDDLERNLFFLYRDGKGAVLWAYPVTAEKTPHRITLDSGQRLYGA
jgi:hypothetical protein